LVWIAILVGSAGLASACGQSSTSPGDAGMPTGPLEARPPAVVPPEKRITASSSPVVFDPLRGGVWTANGDVGTISFVDVDTRRVIQEIAIGQDIRSIALSPDAAWIAAVDRTGATVALVDAETRQVRRVIALGTHPRACVWDAADPRWLYVAAEDDGAVVVVDRTLGQIAATIDVGRLPSGLAVSRGVEELYVTHRIDADLTVVDLSGRSVAADVGLADEPFTALGTPNGKPLGFEALALTPDGSRAWVPHELLAPTHPFVFNQTLFPAISVVDLTGRVEQQTDPNDPAGKIDGRKNLFDAIAFLDPDGQPSVLSQICAVAIHPRGGIGWAIACGSEDLLTFDVIEGRATRLLRSPGGTQCDHPAGLTLDDTGQRVFVVCDQSHTLVTLDTADGSLVQSTTEFGAPIPLVAKDPVDPETRSGLTLFFRANVSKGTTPTTTNNWMSCGGCHLDGFGSTNLRQFEALVARDPQTDAEIGHGSCGPLASSACTRLVDDFSTVPAYATPCNADAGAPGACFRPHDVLTALHDQGALIDPDLPSADASRMAPQLARVIARDLPLGPSWLHSSGKPSVASDGSFCGDCHKAEYAAWTKSVHAHAAEDPMVLYGVGVEMGLIGEQGSRVCAGCHDPVSARVGDVAFQARRGVTCLGCHDVDREIRAGGNGDLQATAYDWTIEHKARGIASLDKLRQPEFCGGCHEQFVPGTGLAVIGTLDEYHASPYVGSTRCLECHMAKDAKGVADHRFPGGNVFLGERFGDAALVQAQKASLSLAVSLQARRVSGGVMVTVRNRGAAHGFPTGVTDIREPWVEVQAKDASGNVLAHLGGPSTDKDLLPDGAARMGTDIAGPAGAVLLRHELTEATRIPFDVRVPAAEAQALFVALPATLPPGTASLDAVLNYRNVRTTYFRAAAAGGDAGDPNGAAPTIEVARAPVPPP
jgi:DNA-binding beta-propeller fold protein YncE